MKIILEITEEHRDILVEALDRAAADHARQASRPGASMLAKRGHLALRDDVEFIRALVTTSASPTEDSPHLEAIAS